MFNVYELYDLHRVLIAIRAYPEDPLNKAIVSNILTVLNQRFENHNFNQIRKALQSVDGICEKDIYDFVFTENSYTYFPLPFLKDEGVYAILCAAMEELVVSFEEKKPKKIIDLADCLHNLPIVLAENHYTIPKKAWTFIEYYRSKWNNSFLQAEQKSIKNKKKIFRVRNKYNPWT